MQKFAEIQRVDQTSIKGLLKSLIESTGKSTHRQSRVLPLSEMLPWNATAAPTVLAELKWSERQQGKDTMGMIQLNENCERRLENHMMVRTLPLQLLSCGTAPGGNLGMNYSPSYHGLLSILVFWTIIYHDFWCDPYLPDTCVNLSTSSELERKTQLTRPPPTPNNYPDDRNHFLNSLLGSQEIKHSTTCCLVINYDTANKVDFNSSHEALGVEESSPLNMTLNVQ